MNIRINRCTWRQKPRCRYCAERAQWDLCREVRYYNSVWERICDKHLGLALRNLGLNQLTIEHTATCTATVRP